MKKLLLALIVLGLLVVPIQAEETSKATPIRSTHLSGKTATALRNHTHEYTDKYDEESGVKDLKIGVGVEQNLVKFTENINLTASVGKDVHQTNAQDGWEIWVMVKLEKPLLDLTKKEEE